MNIGKKIRLLRHQKSWSQEEVARQLDLSIPALSKIECGITDMNLSRVEQIAKLFGMSVIQLLTYGEENTSEREELISKSKVLSDRDAELISLQEKVIQLHEELRQLSRTG